MIEYGALTAEVTKAFSQVSVDDAIGRLEEAGIANARLWGLAGLVEHEQPRPETAGARSTSGWGRSKRRSSQPRRTATNYPRRACCARIWPARSGERTAHPTARHPYRRQGARRPTRRAQ